MAEQIAEHLAEKIQAMPESGMLFWRLTLHMADGSVIHGVICGHNGVDYGFMAEGGRDISPSQIRDVEWEGPGRPSWVKSR